MTAGCGCVCSSGGFWGGCGHAGCGRHRTRPVAPARPIRSEADWAALDAVHDAVLDAEDIRAWLSEHSREDSRVAGLAGQRRLSGRLPTDRRRER
jgi:hypothetical protein